MEKRKLPHGRNFSSFRQSVFPGKRNLQEKYDCHDRKKRRIKQICRFFRKGSGGSSLIGIAVMALVLLVTTVIILLFYFSMRSDDIQIAADSLADGVAVYMANENGTYETACSKMQETEDLIKQETGIELSEVVLDEESLDENEAKVTVKASGSMDSGLFNNQHLSYTFTKTAVTKFKKRTTMSEVYGVDSNIDYVQWAIDIANDSAHGYCLHDIYQGMGHPDYDCSSLVSAALMEYGYISYSFSTGGEYSALTGIGFTCLPYEEGSLKPGDILYRPYTVLSDGSTLSAHTEIYVGNGWIVGAHQSEDADSDYSYGAPGDQTGQEISVSLNDSVAKMWTRIFRLTSVKS